MSDELIYALPVRQADADNLSTGKVRQLARSFPCDPMYIGSLVAIQATTTTNPLRARWSIVGVGRLTGVGYYPGFDRNPDHVIGKSYRRDTGMAGAWGWTFTHMASVSPIALKRYGESWGRYDPGMNKRVWEWKDDGGGDDASCCLRLLDADMMDRVREARRKSRERK